MNVYTWTIGASHTPAAFLAFAGTALPFDVTDTIATLLFALAFGPALVRLLERTRERMTVRWEPRPPEPHPPMPTTPGVPVGGGTARGAMAGGASSIVPAILAFVAVAVAGLASGGTVAHASTVNAHVDTHAAVIAHTASLSPELSYLTSAQNSDGGFGAARGQGSSELYTAWSAMGLAAAGRDPADVSRDGHSVLDSLRAEVSTLQGLGDVERTILAAHACGASAYSFAGHDLVAEVLRAREHDSSFDDQVNLTAFAIFALRAVGHSSGFASIREAAAVDRAPAELRRRLLLRHSWLHQRRRRHRRRRCRRSWTRARATRACWRAAADFLIRSQNPDGGLPQQHGGESNAQSTAWAIQGLIAAGRNPATVRRRGSRSPLGYLESLIAPDGSVRYSRTGAQTPVWVTAQALIALAGRTFPVGP